MRSRKPHPHYVEHYPVEGGSLWLEYNRLSDDNDAQSVSIEHQHEACIELVGHLGSKIAARFCDFETGRNPDRIAFREMLELARTGIYAGILFYSPDRLYRGLAGAGPVISLHAELPSLRWESARDSFHIEQLGVWATITEREWEAIRRRTTEQRLHRARQGESMAGELPYWVDRDPQTKRPVVNWRRAAWVMRAVRRYMAGERTTVICRWLRANAPVNPRAPHSTWSLQAFLQLLEHPALTGQLPYSWRERISEWRQDRWDVRIAKNDSKRIDLDLPALLHRDEQELATCRIMGGCPRDKRPTQQSVLEFRRSRSTKLRGRPKPANTYPLRGKLICIGCGAPMHVRTISTQRLPDGRMVERPTVCYSISCFRMSSKHERERRGLPRCRSQVTIGGIRLWRAAREQIVAAVGDLPSIEQRIARWDGALSIHRYSKAARIRRPAAGVGAERGQPRLTPEMVAELHAVALKDLTAGGWSGIVSLLVERVEVSYANEPRVVFRSLETAGGS